MMQDNAARALAVINMLGSENEGERLNAATILAGNAAKRGLLVSDYLRTLLLALDARASAAPRAPEPDGLSDAHRARLVAVLARGNPWERNFASDVLARNRPLSVSQLRVLERAERKMRDGDAPNANRADYQRAAEERARANAPRPGDACPF